MSKKTTAPEAEHEMSEDDMKEEALIVDDVLVRRFAKAHRKLDVVLLELQDLIADRKTEAAKRAAEQTAKGAPIQ
jgi:hypothetical protein